MNKHWTAFVSFLVGIVIAFGGMRLTGASSPAAIIINPPAPTETPSSITVYINGEVNAPGIYELPYGSRVEALLDMAGGVTDEADEDGINMAALLTDGAQLFVASTATVTIVNEDDSAVRSSTAPQRSTVNTRTTIDSANDSATNDTSADGGTPININTADRDQLEQISGVGESTAKKILAYREDNGPFLSIEDIMNVSGIGEAKFDAMRSMITVEN